MNESLYMFIFLQRNRIDIRHMFVDYFFIIVLKYGLTFFLIGFGSGLNILVLGRFRIEVCRILG